MRKITALLIFCNLLLYVVAASTYDRTPVDSLYPQLGNRGYDVQHYDIRLSYDGSSGDIAARTTLTIVALDDLSEFALDLQGLDVETVRVDDRDADYTRDASKLRITAPTRITQGQTFTVYVRYSGQPEPNADSGTSSARGWNFNGKRVYVVSEPSGASTWYPSNDHPTDKATYDIRVSVLEPYEVIASGLLVDIETDGFVSTYHYQMIVPAASYLVGVHIGEYEELRGETRNGVLLRSYAPEGLGIQQYAGHIAQLDAMIVFFSETFGMYPFEAYGILVEPAFPNANEMQTLPVFNPGFVNELVMVHELAHQWFGNHVTLADWSDIWLNEGFATYAEYLWYESQGRVHPLFNQRGYRYIQTLPPPKAMTPDNLFPATVYHRGGWTLHALRLRVGDDVFFEIIRTYYQSYSGSHASTDDFIAIAEQVSGDDLGAFFQAWLYDETPPPVAEYE